MPIYSYQCTFCSHEFDEVWKSYKGSGKTLCNKCGNTAFKIPAVFSPRIFKKRDFADGTSTPDHVRTPKQEKDWMKSQGITYDAPTVKKLDIKRKNKKKRETAMELAFKKAHEKVQQGLKFEGKKQKEVKNALQFEV